MTGALKKQIFSDGIGSIAIIGGVVRIDLVTFSTTEKDAGGQPKAVFQQQVVMSAEAFLRSTEKMQGAVQAFAKLAAGQRPAEPPAAHPSPAPDVTVLEPAVKRPFP